MKTVKLSVILLGFVLVLPQVASGQLVSQSELTKADVDTDFKLTLDHLSYDSRWLGLSPRAVTWSPDSETVYFRWRPDPASGQNPDTDPWYGVDRGSIGLYGGSCGGFFTIMSLFRHPGKYKAGVALYPVTDWAHYNQGYTSRILNGTPQSDDEAYRRSSPIYYAEGLSDHLQIQHGLVDNNVQIQDSFRLSQILMEMKKDFDMVVYPVEDHGWDEVPSRRDSYRRMTEWFNRHLLGGSGSVSSNGRNQ